MMNFLRRRSKAENKSQSHRATPDEVRKAFLDYRDELDQLAFFLTGDREMAEACIVDACTLAISGNQVFEEWLGRWARRATIRSAINMQRDRMLHLATTYGHRPPAHREHAILSSETAELVMEHADILIVRLDVLCRCALALRGIERYSPREASVISGINQRALDSAYLSALDSLTNLNREILHALNARLDPCIGSC